MQSTAVRAGELRGNLRWVSTLIGTPGPSLFDAIFPRATVLHRLLAVAAFVALTAGLAQARFFLPDNPVPITFQTYGVLMTGGVMGFRWGLLSAVAYYLVGMAGAPVFQSGGNGWAYVAEGVTGGYLLGFILATATVGFLSQRGWDRGRSLWPMLLASLLVYLPGLIWLRVFDFGWPAEGQLFSSGMYPFMPGDMVKFMLAALSVGALWHVAGRRAQNSRSSANGLYSQGESGGADTTR